MPPDRPPDARKQHATPPLPLRRSTSDGLPTQLRGVVPQCAQQCLTTYIDQEYACPQNGFPCLCQDYSSHGFTLGELAYICWHKDCDRENQSEGQKLYKVCHAQANAAQPTFSVLTPPATRASTSFASTQISTTPHLASTPTYVSPSPSSSASTSPSTPSPRSSAMRTASSSTSSQLPASPSTAESSSSPIVHRMSGLSGGELAGVVIAAIIAAAFLVSGLILWIFYRRRRERDSTDEKSYDFVDKDPSVFSPVNQSFSQPPRSLPQLPASNMRPVDRDTVQYWQLLATPPTQHIEPGSNPSIWRIERPEDIRMGTPPPRDQTSIAAPLQGLPPRPKVNPLKATVLVERKVQAAPSFNGYGLPPNPRANIQQSSPTPTLPELGQPSPNPDAKKSSLPMIRPPSESLDVSTSAPRTPMQSESSASAIPKSPMISPVEVGPQPQASPSKSSLRPPPALASPYGFTPLSVVVEESSGTERPVPTPRSQSRDSSVSLLNYYSSADAGGAILPSPIFVTSPTAIEPAKPRKVNNPPPAIIITKRPGAPMAVRRDSEASDTSFESADPDEPTPPDEEDKQLTPVQESPIETTSPIADIRYPKIPRSANQSIPRSPPLSSPPPPPHQPLAATIRLPNPSNQNYRAYTPKSDLQSEEWPLKTPVTPNNPIKPRTSSLSGSTLAAKRRGSSAAQSLELRLDIPEKAYSPFGSNSSSTSSLRKNHATPPRSDSRGLMQNSPLKGYGRVANSASPHKPSRVRQDGNARPRKQRRMPPPDIRTEIWEPKLTPERRGDDLFLQVGLATPLKGTF